MSPLLGGKRPNVITFPHGKEIERREGGYGRRIGKGGAGNRKDGGQGGWGRKGWEEEGREKEENERNERIRRKGRGIGKCRETRPMRHRPAPWGTVKAGCRTAAMMWSNDGACRNSRSHRVLDKCRFRRKP